jgi:hypothetical protein
VARPSRILTGFLMMDREGLLHDNVPLPSRC